MYLMIDRTEGQADSKYVYHSYASHSCNLNLILDSFHTSQIERITFGLPRDLIFISSREFSLGCEVEKSIQGEYTRA